MDDIVKEGFKVDGWRGKSRVERLWNGIQDSGCSFAGLKKKQIPRNCGFGMTRFKRVGLKGRNFVFPWAHYS